MYNVRPELRYFERVLEISERSTLNPHHLGCWSDESYLGKIKHLGQRCHGKSILRTSMLRYFLFLGLRWEARRRSNLWTLQ